MGYLVQRLDAPRMSEEIGGRGRVCIAVIIGLVYRPQRSRLHAPNVVSLALLAIGIVNIYVLYVHGE